MAQASKPSLARFRDFIIFPERIANSDYQAEVDFRLGKIPTVFPGAPLLERH
jgi:hypothetical protein